jgi:hypothetical protein
MNKRINLNLSKDRQISLDEAVRIINTEVQWCHQHPGMVSDEYQKAFIKGLEQARYLLVKLAECEE